MAETSLSSGRVELLHIADAVAREKNIQKALVLHAMEDAIQKVARLRYGSEHDIRAEINPKTGEVYLYRVLEVVEEVDNPYVQISLAEAQAKDPALTLGETFSEVLPPVDFGRIAAQSAKQVIVQKVREAERDRQYEDFKKRIGEMVSGVVKRVEYGNIIMDVGRTEAVIRRDDLIPRESFRSGDRIRAYLSEVRRESKGAQVFLSRVHPQFMARLFAQEVPEIYDGIVEIMAVSRDPGSRGKIAVRSKDSAVDPVGSCVGMRGARVQAVVTELKGEKVDIIPWSSDMVTFVVNALQPSEVSKVILDEEANKIEAIVPDDQLSLAIGRRGQNVKLASQLTGHMIEILTETAELERRHQEFLARTEKFMTALDMDETLAQLLASEGFETLEELAYVDPSEMLAIEGLEEEMVSAIQVRAQEVLEEIAQQQAEKVRSFGFDERLVNLVDFPTESLIALGESDILTLEDFAGCATDDLLGWTERRDGEVIRHRGTLSGQGFSLSQIQSLIMAARVELGWIAPSEVEVLADDDFGGSVLEEGLGSSSEEAQ